MKELKVKPCANGKYISATYDEKDNTIVLFDFTGMSLGYVELDQIQTNNKSGDLVGNMINMLDDMNAGLISVTIDDEYTVFVTDDMDGAKVMRDAWDEYLEEED